MSSKLKAARGPLSGRLGLWGLLGLLAAPGAHAADPTPIAPKCDLPYVYDAGTKACKPSATFKDLKGELCTGNFGTLAAEECKPPAADKMPKPNCGDSRFRFKEGQCFVDDSTPSSSEGDYVGDCFTIRGVTPALRDKGMAPLPGADYRLMLVTSQKDISDGKDRELKVVDAKFFWKPLWCVTEGGAEVKTIKASEMLESGAARRGWVFGAMVVPFKYYKEGGSQTGNLSVGPYAGWRYSRNGSGFTLAVSAALSTIQGEVRDSANNFIDRPQLVGYTAAVGVLWDISKRPGARPFQLGFVVGQDRVGRSNVTKFQQNGETWFALQVGYRFTDN